MVEVPLPDAAVAEELKSRRDSIDEQLAYAGMSEADYLESEGQTEDEFAADLDKRVRDAMAAQFLLDEIANAEALGVDESELTQHLLRRAQQAGQSPEEYVKHVMEHNHVPELVAEIRRGKALARVVESATVKDASGSVVELKTLQPDGTYAEPGAVDDSEDGGVVESAEESQPPARDASADIQVVGGSDFVRIEDAADPQAEPAGEA
jgi:trigger factor